MPHLFNTIQLQGFLHHEGGKINAAERELKSLIAHSIAHTSIQKLKSVLLDYFKQSMRHANEAERFFTKEGIALPDTTPSFLHHLIEEAELALGECQQQTAKELTILYYLQQVCAYKANTYGQLGRIAERLGWLILADIYYVAMDEERQMTGRLKHIDRQFVVAAAEKEITS